MPTVRLKANWPGPEFRRVMRDRDGISQRVLYFPRGQNVELTEEEYAAVRADIGPALEERPAPPPVHPPPVHRPEQTTKPEPQSRRNRKRPRPREVREDATAQEAPPAAEE